MTVRFTWLGERPTVARHYNEWSRQVVMSVSRSLTTDSSCTIPTDYTYMGQYSNIGDFGLMYYNARWPQGPHHRALRPAGQSRAGRCAGVG
jgi:hypothetical protein